MNLMQGRVVAKIGALPPTWKITFDLKLIRDSKLCCMNCANGIIQMRAKDSFPLRNMPNIKYSCKTPKTAKRAAGHRDDAVIVINHMVGRFYRRDEKKELVPGKWSSFEISQTEVTYKYKYNKTRLEFKVNIIEFSAINTYTL